MMARLLNVLSDNKKTPIVKLKGKYLRDCGFNIGDRIAVLNEEHGKITILNVDIQMQKALEEELEQQVIIIK